MSSDILNSQTQDTEENFSLSDDDEFDRLLNDFISKELNDVNTSDMGENTELGTSYSADDAESDITPDTNQDSFFSPSVQQNSSPLSAEEKGLFDAYNNFAQSIKMMSQTDCDFSLTEENFLPRYKPYLADIIHEETLNGWDIMLQTYPQELAQISPTVGDEDLLDFAEKTNDDILQFAIISYVEILIEMESCDIAYEKRRISAKKRRLQRQIQEEHEARQKKIQEFIEKINKKRFPINAERLILNYFKTARKDPKGAFQILTKNPATFAPIEVDRIPDKFFGLIKKGPEDGIRMNIKIGKFLKKLNS